MSDERIDAMGGNQDIPDHVENGRDRFSNKVREILPEAVAGSLSDDDRLANALYPTVERSLTRSVRKDSQTLVDAIFPILGPMIRRNIAETMRGMVQSLNRSIEYTFSIRGLKWRWEAFVTRTTFAEVVMLHSLAYRVEQVFLIHKKTGLLLMHVAVESVVDSESKENMVSAMFTAIQDFVSDSFDSEEDSQLSSIQMGDLTVWLEQCSDIVVAGVVRGDLPPSVQTHLRETAERVQSMMGEKLADFDGDVAPFERIRFDLENCLKEHVNEHKRLIPLTWIVLITPIVVLLGWSALTTTENWQWNKYIRNVRSQPGLIVIEEGHRDGDFYIMGMRDTLAADPLDLLSKQPLIAAQVKSRWIPYHSLHPDFVLKRVVERLEPQTSVTLNLKDGQLIVQGSASHDWIESIQDKVAGITGIMGVDTDNLKDSDMAVVRAWSNFLQRLKSSRGILLTRVNEDGLSFEIDGFRDPLALSATELLGSYPELEGRVKMRWESYFSVVPEFVLKRAEAILQPPDSITLNIDQKNRLLISGHAKRDWIERTRVVAPTISGLSSVDESDLHDIDGNRDEEWRRYLELLDEASGLVVIEQGERGGKFYLVGFQNQLSADPYDILETVGVSKKDITAKWIPSPSVTKQFVLSNAQQVLSPPETVALQRVDKTLIATGSAGHDWIRDARIIARCLPGIDAFDFKLLVDEDIESLNRMRYEIEKVLVIYDDKATPASGQALVVSKLVSSINNLHVKALKLNSHISITVIGDARSITEGGRRMLAQQRADIFSALLVRGGVPASILKTSIINEEIANNKNNAGLMRREGITFQVQIVTPEDEK